MPFLDLSLTVEKGTGGDVPASPEAWGSPISEEFA